MGLPCSKISSWRRCISSDAYKENCDWEAYRSMHVDPGTFLTQALGRFRHDIYNYGLKNYPYNDCNTKSIYLYLDGLRIMKVSMSKQRLLDIEFRNDDIMNRFANAVENPQKHRKEFETQFFFVNFFADSNYFSWPFTRYVKKIKNYSKTSITI